MIEEHLSDYELEDEVMDRVISLNAKYNSIVESEEEVARNVNWRLDTFQWDNLFNYGEENSVDFSNLTGIVGIFGKNYSGKSSIVDAALYTLFNSTSKNERKNLNIINQNREVGMGRIGLSIGDRQFVVERTSEKYTKKLKGEETLEAKTNVDFTEIDALGNEIISHNGMTRADTDKNIRKMLGTLDDFLLTSMASQLDSLTFIKEGSTRRKEILAKFLDLEIFDKKYKLAKDDASDMRGALKRLEDKNFDEEMEQAVKELAISDEDIATNKIRCKTFEENTLTMEAELQDLENKISSIPINIIDIDDYRNKLETKTTEAATLVDENTESIVKKQENEELVIKLIDFLNKYDIENLKNKKEEATNKESERIEVENSLKNAEKDVITANNKVKLLDEVPCGDKYTSCKFICNAHTAKEVLPNLNKQVSELRKQGEDILNQLEQLEADKVDDYLTKYDALVNRRTAVESEISVLSLQIGGNISKVEVIRHEIEEIEKQIEIYEVNKDAIENLEHLVSDKKKKARDLIKIKKEHDECITDLNDLFMAHGSYEQKLQNLEEQKAELADLREEYSAYDLFTKCMHSSGISYDIIKRKLPAINEEIAKVLTNIVDFEVFFENDGRRLNVYIRHPRHEPRPIELGSGAEKTIASMAIRLALLHVSSLPSPSVFILDEPGTALDAENLEGFVRILEMVKSYFKTVILISHLDSLKDCVDHVISIEKENGFAKVVV
jgi:exonuclease SbcC